MQIFFQPIQNINHRRPAVQEPVSVHAAVQRHRSRSIASRPRLRDKIAKLPGLLDVTTDLYIKNPQMTVEIDREKAAVYGITVDQVRQELYNAFGSRQVATIYTPSNDYQVILETQPRVPGRARPISTSIYLKTDQRHHGPAVGGDAASCRRSVRCRSTTRASSRR